MVNMPCGHGNPMIYKNKNIFNSRWTLQRLFSRIILKIKRMHIMQKGYTIQLIIAKEN